MERGVGSLVDNFLEWAFKGFWNQDWGDNEDDYLNKHKVENDKHV